MARPLDEPGSRPQHSEERVRPREPPGRTGIQQQRSNQRYGAQLHREIPVRVPLRRLRRMVNLRHIRHHVRRFRIPGIPQGRRRDPGNLRLPGTQSLLPYNAKVRRGGTRTTLQEGRRLPVNPLNPASPLHDDLFSGKDGTTIAVTPKDSAESVNTSTDFGPDNDLGFGIVIGLLIGIILGKMFP